MVPSRRRTDVPDPLWRGAAAELSDQSAARQGSERRTGSGLDSGSRPPASSRPPAGARPPVEPSPLSRPRLPLPPVPAASRGVASGRPSVPTRTPVVGPMTSAAPFRAVPTPEPRVDLPVDPLPGLAPVAVSVGAPLERPARKAGAVPPRPALGGREAEALVSTGPGIGSGIKLDEPAPRLPRQTTANGSSSSAYGDWTKPSRSGAAPLSDAGNVHGGNVRADDFDADNFDADNFDGDFDAELEADAQLRIAPGTTAIPERSVRGRRQRPVDDLDDDLDDGPRREVSADDYTGDAPAVRGPATGPVSGGRAAMRAERQAVDAKRRKAVKRSGGSTAVIVDPEEDGERRRPRRVLQALVAMTVVALGVLGVYSFVSPNTTEAGSSTAAGPSTTPALAPQTDVLPALPTAPVVVEQVPTVPVRVPITVLNSTDITGLAAKAAASFGSSGWEAPVTGAYPGTDVAASAVFFTPGDETQRQAAVQLVDQFPQLQGPAPRFFDLPADVAATGLVVVVTGDWRP
ncbi:MAG: LytR cell envelope-related transcriptional attenuator [Blastococcus sp.]|nr:LytR cell envelope-related transcriptional attenuator [Blastococcus sp.]